MTTDCPICLCPITSEVWGVVNPCGHPYHRDCWKEVVAANSSRRGSNNSVGGGNTNAKCAICKGATEGFVPVYVDLADNDDSNDDAGGESRQDAENDSDEDDDDDEAALEELHDDWYSAYGQLGDLEGHDEGTEAHDLLDRLHCIHQKFYERLTSNYSSTSRASSSSNSKSMIQRQLERMKSKAKKLQSINAELQSSNERLQSANATLHRSSIDAAVEKERTVVKYKKLQSQFNALGQSYEQYETKTELEKQVLQSKVSQLQTEYAKLVTKSNINELHEMESIRVKYSKMSQEVHDLKAKNRMLESDISRNNRDWEVKHEQEKLRYIELTKEMKHLSSQYYQLVGDDDGDVSRRNSSLGNTQSRGSTANKTVTSDSSRSSSATNKHNMLRNDNNGGTKAIVSQRQDVIDAQIRRDSIGQPNPFNLLQKKNGLTTANIMTSGRKKNNNNNGEGSVNDSRGRKAMEALNKSTVRKKQQQQVHGLKQPHTLLPSDNRHLTTTQSSRLSHDGMHYNEREGNNEKHNVVQLHHDNDDDDQLQLMIKPRSSNNKRKYDSISSSNNVNSCEQWKALAKVMGPDRATLALTLGKPKISERERGTVERKRRQAEIDDIFASPPATEDDDIFASPPATEENDDIFASAPATTSSSRSVVATSASYSPRKKKGSITTYFKHNNKSKPLPPLAERSYPSYQPHIFFGSDLATSFN